MIFKFYDKILQCIALKPKETSVKDPEFGEGCGLQL